MTLKHIHSAIRANEICIRFRCFGKDMGDREVVERAIAARTKNLHALGRFIWENPETAFQEVKAHNYITAYLEEEGFRVKRNHGLSTAFRAEYGGMLQDTQLVLGIH